MMQNGLSSVATRCSIPILMPITWSPAHAKNWSVLYSFIVKHCLKVLWFQYILLVFHLFKALGINQCGRVPLSFVVSACLQFEYQQAQLEAEIENLSWKVERADSYERGVVGGEGELSASDRGVRTAQWV